MTPRTTPVVPAGRVAGIDYGRRRVLLASALS